MNTSEINSKAANMQLFQGKRVTIAGLGIHGGALGNIRWLHEQGAQLIVTDLKSKEELSVSIDRLADLNNITYVFGEHQIADFTNTDLVLRNPAMPRHSEYLEAARRAGVPISMDSDLFFKFSPTRNIIGITGSKGKSTTAFATCQLLKLKHANVTLVGIDGVSPLKNLSALKPDDVVVFELSSWRLEALDEYEISPHTAVVTSIYRDHLNTYDSLEQYIETKQSIIRYQKRNDRVLLNYDDLTLRQWTDKIRSRIYWYSLSDNIPGNGICIRRKVVTLIQQNASISLFPLSTIDHLGEHEKRNMLPAIFLAFSAGVRLETIRLHLPKLARLSHRLETVKIVNDVAYINDSAATIPDATIAAIKSMGNKRIVLILGGSDKELNFEELAETLPNYNISTMIFLSGNTSAHMRDIISSAYRQPPTLFNAANMPEAVTLAQQQAKNGDVVLLSPAATSFGLFKHEFDRGEQFKKEVKHL